MAPAVVGDDRGGRTPHATDFIRPFYWHLGFTTHPDLPELLTAGQNLDSIVAPKMGRFQVSFTRYLLSTGDLPEVLKWFGASLQYADAYMESGALHRLYAAFAPRVFGADWVTDTTPRGYLEGLISTGRPHMVKRAEKGLVEAEIQRFVEFIGGTDLRSATDALVFHHSMSHEKKKLHSTIPVAGERRMLLPAMWGPLASYYLGTRRSVLEAYDPKRDVHEYVERETGRSYYDLIEDFDEHQRLQEKEERLKRTMHSPFLELNRDLFETDNSHVLRLVRDETLEDRSVSIYDDVRGGGSIPRWTSTSCALHTDV